MTASTPFPPELFERNADESRRSAEVVVPHVLALLGGTQSALDVGCGVGGWLAALRDHGVTDVVGLEAGDPRADQLLVPPDVIRPVDLEEPFSVGRTFDLIVCLEVAEHLPAASATGLVSSFAAHGDAVLFSAAIPGQGGDHHINEQWPAYWHERFEAEGYDCFDILRRSFWTHPEVVWWYGQNLLLFARADRSERLKQSGHVPGEPLPLIHPTLYESWIEEAGRPRGLKESAQLLATAARRRLASLFRPVR